jgi:glycosyltransferase 2 family protein
MRQDLRGWARMLGGAAILGVIVWRLGAGPFVNGVRSVDGWSLVAAAVIALMTTICCAWRWTLVARGLGVAVTMRSAVAACYRSQFLNVATPGGVLGDVHRGLRQGRAAGDTGCGMRSVVWERFAGQLVLLALALPLLALLPSPVRGVMPVVAPVAVLVVLAAAVLVHRGTPRSSAVWARTLRTAAADVRAGLLPRRTWPLVALASALAVAGHLLTFLIAAHSAGADASPTQVLPLAVLVLVAMGVPASIAGWGPREGVASWVFGAAGLGAQQGAVTAVVYGVMVFIASLPGAALLVSGRRKRCDPCPIEVGTARSPVSLDSATEGAARA